MLVGFGACGDHSTSFLTDPNMQSCGEWNAVRIVTNDENKDTLFPANFIHPNDSSGWKVDCWECSELFEAVRAE